MADLTNGIEVEGIKDAERTFLDALGESGYTYMVDNRPSKFQFCGEHASLPTLIDSCSNRIAVRTRRGPGNIALMNKKVLSEIITAVTLGGVSSETTMGWTFEGTLNHYMKIYTSNRISDDKVVIIYRGASRFIDDGKRIIHDCPAIFVDNADGKKLFLMEDFKDYAPTIHIKW